ncbi:MULTISPECIES: flagellar hook-basal body complex protein FliE [unclassified Undibacterium]|nr:MULTISPECIES: flagellar hook-basal body complex protein FliE [unclassified Undibacterium]MEB0172784.1 flagellar hook-basal body complex protein FliE [Undibacterium sp. CCC1.1]MEB0176576.1 flagellar hook-basal body complex protein FliE [Undibacterium sp. CCC3.4]MEB0215834.1 flagellar hook-basal body complex protein FliE [Undibacterium sp. 5I2]WPX42685.1 flagellar hook-basal body complex protein FliE [Undibacterium sp. CCC3.4]
MNVGGIDRSQIDAMVAQLKAAAAKMEPAVQPVGTAAQAAPSKVNFADTLKATLDQVNQVQSDSQKLGEKFALGDDKVSLADVMISMQKASISFQTTVQVRNKLVSAYHDIMSMQI